jgi:hypothetical protein
MRPRGDDAIRSAILARTRVLLTAVVMASVGCAHAQRPERKVYIISNDVSSAESGYPLGTGGAGAEAYCNELQKQCFNKCWRRKPDLPTIKKHSEKHYEHCSKKCLDEFTRCIKEQEELERQELKKELSFTHIDAALDWLRSNPTEASPGTSVVVAGVVFVVAIIAGALVLSPL